MNCPYCSGPMANRSTPSLYHLECEQCGAHTFDGTRGSELGVNIQAAFEKRVVQRSPSPFKCPVHEGAMNQAVLAEGGWFLYASCCSLVSVKAETMDALKPPQAAPPPALGSAFGQPAHATVPVAGAQARTCGFCSAPLVHHDLEAVDLDRCDACKFVFLDEGEPEKIGIDTRALFTNEPWGAPLHPQAAQIPCPVHGTHATAYKMQFFDNTIVAYMMPCCKGIYVGEAHLDMLRSVARKAVYDRAEAYALQGKKPPATRAEMTRSEQRLVALQRGLNDVMRSNNDRAIEEAQRRRAERAERAARAARWSGNNGNNNW